MSLQKGVLDLGEVVMAPRFLDRPKHYCACGEQLMACRIWSTLPEPLKHLPHTDASLKSHLAMLESIATLTDHEFIIDSSKTARHNAFRPFYLRRHLSYPLQLVHLVRDPRACVWSVIRWRLRGDHVHRHAYQLGVAALTAFSWIGANLAAELYRFCHHEASVRVNYDELLQRGFPDSLKSLGPVGRLEDVVIERNENCHSMGGNEIRNRARVIVEQDTTWKAQIPKSVRILVTALTWPLMLRYGFLQVRR